MLYNKEFKNIKKEIDIYEKKRDELVRISRDIVRTSKLIIYAVHRNDQEKAKNLITMIENKKRSMEKLVKNDQKLRYSEIFNISIQEYVEAKCYYEFVKNKKIPARNSLKVGTEPYLMGLCDLSGELVRRAVNDIINKDFESAVKIKNFVEELYGKFSELDIAGGELRKKADALRWNLNKLEDLVLEASAYGRIR